MQLNEILGDQWYPKLKSEFDKDYMRNLSLTLARLYSQTRVFPSKGNIFNAFKLCGYDDVKVVILGQDPYHTPGVAHGLSFSSLEKKTPPSLQNIFKEIRDELYSGEEIDNLFKTNDLTNWAKQGVFLLNTILTVEEGKPLSHGKLGWIKFTIEVIRKLNNKENPIVFVLWGEKAKNYKYLITNPNHLILESAHPSPFSCTGFFGNGHFKKINEFMLKEYNINMEWKL